MSDLTEAQKVSRGEQARRALGDFLSPAFEAVIAAYTDRIEELASTQPWEAAKITALANATRIAKQAHAHISALVYEGQHARAGMVRVQEIEKLSPAKRRLLNIGGCG